MDLDITKRKLQQPQVLRVRRHRTADSANTLRVAPQLDVLLEDHWGLNQHNESSSSTAVYYERVDGGKNKRRKGDIFHAQLVEEKEQRATKRRKLQPLDHPATATTLAIHEYATLTPEQNKVNESLLMVFQGTRSLSEHYDMLQTTFDDEWGIWWEWCSPSGTWLHAAALWNEHALVKSILLQKNLSDDILHALDEEGHSALEIARLSCHEEMMILLEQLEEESEFVYDVYEFRRPESIDTTMADTDDGLNILDCELLRHNVGHNPEGLSEDSELLEPTGQSDDENDDDDDDSNHEDWFANDYPDEESSSEGGRFPEYDDGEFDPVYDNVYGE